MIKREGTRWVLYSKDGAKRLGVHDTEAEAQAQEALIQRLVARRSAEARSFHLLGATSKARTEMVGSREHLVVPVVMLMEGVIHAVNAETPEFVPFETLKSAAESWNGKPVTLGHPKRNGTQCSASTPGVWDAAGLGTIRGMRADEASKKMLGEALVEKARAKRLHPDMYQTLEGGGTVEVSVGALVVTDRKPGRHTNGKQFLGSWTFAEGDHLAFLPGGRGACSVEMGCGTHRAATMRVCEAGFEVATEAELRALWPNADGFDDHGRGEADAAWAKGLSKEESDAVKAYAGPAGTYREINSGLRNRDLDPKHSAAVKALDSALDKGGTGPAVTMYRGLSDSAVAAKLVPGAEFTDRGFVSASLDKSHAETHFGQYEDRPALGKTIMEITTNKGAYISSVTGKTSIQGKATDEKEWLLPRGERYRVTSVHEEKRGPEGKYVVRHVKVELL